MLVTSIFSFSHNVFYPVGESEIIISIIFIMSSANAFILDHSKFPLFGKELKEFNFADKRLNAEEMFWFPFLG